jgi:DNA-binding CsgD family transcriptional regulator
MQAWPMVENLTLETLVVSALVFGLIFTILEIRQVLGRQKRMEQQLRAASGAFSQLLEEYFDQWSLTPSEQEVALLSIKGLSIAEMARVRNTKEGTIKAQCNAIYRKADVNSRTQLLSLFIEELLSDSAPLTER